MNLLNEHPSMSAPRLKVINLFGAPGMGKSGIRGGLFFLMKACHLSVEEVSEHAKHLVHTGQRWQLKDEQTAVFGKQLLAQNLVARNGYDYAITDSPLQLCSFYAPADYYSETFPLLVDEAHAKFDNINFFLSRDLGADEAPFEERGRVHDRQASLQAESEMRGFLADRGVTCIDLPINLTTPWRILEHVLPGVAPLPIFGTP